MMVTASWRRASALVVAGLLASTGCSGGERSADESSAAWGICEEFFGAADVEAVRKAMGDAEPRPEAPQKLDALAEAMAEEASTRAANTEDLSRASYEPCRIAASRGDTAQRVSGQVKWSVLTLRSLSRGALAREWRQVAKGVHVHSADGGDRVSLLVTCQVPKAPANQREDVPLEVEVSQVGLSGGDPKLPERLVLSLAGTMRHVLHCTDAVTLPSRLPAR
ncbi:hypothetical protein [Streptomyces sp. NPDC006368]|uniref:hypothetical protein n=1 Tax=Streptomyces sp. NPDC006368 TaxID=3156760 RepID=UPI0033A5774D